MTVSAFDRFSAPRHAAIRGQFLLLCMLLVFNVWLTACTFGVDSEPVPGPGPGRYRILSDDGMIKFPFELFRGDIRFRGEINGREVHMLLDDGFMWDPLLFWGSPRVDSLGLEYDGEVSVGGSDDENAIASKTASHITIRFPGVEFIDQTAVITPYSSGTSNMWWGSEGQVSGTFLKHFVVDINFDDMMITLIEPEKFKYRGSGVEIPWKPLGFGPWAIPASLGLEDGRKVSMDLMMDLGYNDQLQIRTKGEHNIAVPKRALPGSMGFNIQNEETRGNYGRISAVDIGGYEIKDVVAGFVSEEDSDHTFHEVMIGLELLSRFNIIFDYTRQRMFIEPNHSFTDRFEYDMSGMSVKPRGKYFEIARIHPDSPAGEAGLRVGDKVTQINGLPAGEYDSWKLASILRQAGATVTLVVLRDGREMEISIVLRRLI